MILLAALSLLSAVTVQERFAPALPPEAEVVARTEADLTSDGVAEVIVGYTGPGPRGRVGRSAVPERSLLGGYRRRDLPGAWAPHYVPRFTVRDLTGDGRPEVIQEVAGGGAWQMLSVFQRGPGGGYTTLLQEPGGSHLIWDTDGDGLPEVLSENKIGTPAHRITQTFRWLGDRHVAWHAATWYYDDTAELTSPPPSVPNLVGLSMTEAALRANRPLGLIAAVDSKASAGQVVAQTPRAGTTPAGATRIHLAVAAGSTTFAAGPFPGIAYAIYRPEQLHDELGVPAGSGPTQRRRWNDWLTPILGCIRQVIHTWYLSGPAYLFRLARPWTVAAGGRWLSVTWIGIGLEPPYRGLIFLAEQEPVRSPLWPRFEVTLYTATPVAPPDTPPARPLATYLKQAPALDAFVTLAPKSWAEALRLRGIQAEGWPDPDPQPALAGAGAASGPYTPVPDHALITVLNGRVLRARRQDEHVSIDVAPAPGQVHRWPLPLQGFTRGTSPYVHIYGPDPGELAVHTRIPRRGVARRRGRDSRGVGAMADA